MVIKQADDLQEMLTRLEQQELDCQTGSGVVPVGVYCELLACYLANEPPMLPQAKFLVGRVPGTLKQSEEGAEFNRLWAVGRAMWTRDNPGVHAALVGPWSSNVEPLMLRLATAYKEKQIQLVGNAYSTIKLSDLSQYVGMNETETGAMVERVGWGWDKTSGVVSPKQSKEQRGMVPPTEEQLNRLTDFIAFLEN